MNIRPLERDLKASLRTGKKLKSIKRVTPFGWACLSICIVLLAPLWWQPNGTGHYLALALIAALVWSWFAISKDLQRLKLVG